MLRLSIITINYKTLRLTSACIKSIEKNYKKQLDNDLVEIIVVDNASNDKSAQDLEKIGSKINNFRLIRSDQNLGFSKGCNLGASFAKGKYLLFLNSDTVIEDFGFFKMADFMDQHSEVGILGGKLKNLDKTPQSSSGSDYNLWNVIFLLLGFERLGFLRKSPQKTEKVAWVSGASLMIRREIFEKIRGFEKELFMYMEDVDICLRVKQSGYSTYFFPDINLIHRERGSSNRTFAILNIYRGLLFFFKKHKSISEYFLVKNLLMLKAYFLLFFGKLARNEYLSKTYGEAIKIFN